MNISWRLGWLSIASALGLGLATAMSMPAAWADQHTYTLVLNQQAPSLRPIDGGAVGPSTGDILLFEAPLTGEHGESGTLTGFLVTADTPDQETGDLDADRLGELSYDLGNGNTLVAIGHTVYRSENVEMTASLPQLRVVAGGTGSFIGARGQVTTTRVADGTYRHEFTLIDG